MSTRIEECRKEELMAAEWVPISGDALRFTSTLTRRRTNTSGRGSGSGVQGIEQQRETFGEVAVELALALAEELWCRTCGCTVDAGVQGRNHRRVGHVVELR